MPAKAATLNRTRAQRIPFRPGDRCSNKGRIHSRRPNYVFFILRLQNGGEYIPLAADEAKIRQRSEWATIQPEARKMNLIPTQRAQWAVVDTSIFQFPVDL